MVRLVEEEGFTFEAAAAASNVAKLTCWEWVRHWREGQMGMSGAISAAWPTLLAPPPQSKPGPRLLAAAEVRA